MKWHNHPTLAVVEEVRFHENERRKEKRRYNKLHNKWLRDHPNCHKKKKI
jgi:hypothetical protein